MKYLVNKTQCDRCSLFWCFKIIIFLQVTCPLDVKVRARLSQRVVKDGADESRGHDVRAHFRHFFLQFSRIFWNFRQINHSVRHWISRRVNLLQNVDTFGSQKGCDFAEAWHVLFTMVNRAPDEFTCGAKMVVGKFTELRIVPVSKVHQSFCGHRGRVVFGFGGRAQVRQDDQVRSSRTLRP